MKKLNAYKIFVYIILVLLFTIPLWTIFLIPGALLIGVFLIDDAITYWEIVAMPIVIWLTAFAYVALIISPLGLLIIRNTKKSLFVVVFILLVYFLLLMFDDAFSLWDLILILLTFIYSLAFGLTYKVLVSPFSALKKVFRKLPIPDR